jgi:hypothetical protein
MAGRSDCHRAVSSLYQTPRTADAAAGEGPSDRRRRSSGRRRQPPPPPTTRHEEDEEEARPGDDDELVRQTDEEEGAHEEEGRTRRMVRVLLPLVHPTSTCKVRQASLRFRFLTNA